MTWLSVFEERKQAVNKSFGPGYGLPGAVCSIHSFRDAIEALDKRRKKYKASRLDAKLLYTYNSISYLCSAITRSIPDLRSLPSNDNLEALVWWTSFALIEVSRYRQSPPPNLNAHSNAGAVSLYDAQRGSERTLNRSAGYLAMYAVAQSLPISTRTIFRRLTSVEGTIYVKLQ